MIGAWCFLDHFGPTDAPLVMPAHPHTGVQVVTWLFESGLRHRDSLGNDVIVRAGEVGLMTAGWGATQTERSGHDLRTHGVRLWAALPDSARFIDPGFEHFWPEPLRMDDHEVACFVGEFGDAESPVQVHTPLCAAEVRFTSSEPLTVEVDDSWEFGVLADSGEVEVDATLVPANSLGYLAPGRRRLTLRARANPGRVVRAIVVGGRPLGEQIVMWWNFVGRSHQEIAAWRANYLLAIGQESDGDNAGNFPPSERLDDLPEVPAPPLPSTRLLPRPAHRGR